MYPLWVQSPVALIFKVKAKFHLRNFHIRDKNVWKSTWIIQLITHLKTDKWNFWISYLLLLVNANAIFQKYSKIFKSTLLGYFDNAIFALRYWNMRCIFNKSLRHCTIVDGLADVWTKMFLSMKKKIFSAVFFQAQKCDRVIILFMQQLCRFILAWAIHHWHQIVNCLLFSYNPINFLKVLAKLLKFLFSFFCLCQYQHLNFYINCCACILFVVNICSNWSLCFF